VKNPDYSDTLYVTELVAPNTVTTMPEPTIEAVADHGAVAGDAVRAHYDDADQVFADLARVGVDMDDVTALLEEQGVATFADSWTDLLAAVDTELARSG
jgi:transaldolase